MESQSNLIVFSSKQSSVSLSENDTSTVQSRNDEDSFIGEMAHDRGTEGDTSQTLITNRGD